MALSDTTPVLIAVGQFTEHLDAQWVGLPPTELATMAVRRAVTTDQAERLLSMVDSIAYVRTFAESVPVAFKSLLAPFGGSDNLPRSVAGRLGINPAEAVLSKACGDEPQRLVAEMAQRIAAGELRAAVICGAEAIASQRRLQKLGESRDWSEFPGGSLVDRGQGIDSLFDPELARHGAVAPVDIYPLLENARRGAQGISPEDYRGSMARLFARFADVAAENPLSMYRETVDAVEIATESAENRQIADPYTRHLVAKDGVNQGAAVMLCSLRLARDLGLAEQAVYLHGHGQAIEAPILDRPQLGASPAMAHAYHQALSAAGLTSADIAAFDLYSCFPIAVFNALDALDVAWDDPRPLTLTGGLPFFGGPGNNYSLHAIAEAVNFARCHPQQYVAVGANGGNLSKHAVGIYGTTPAAPVIADDHFSGHTKQTATAWTAAPAGEARVETYTIKPRRGGAPQIIVIGRLTATDQRFVANVADDDAATQRMFLSGDPLDQRVTANHGESGNRITAGAD